jgi:hypothetical protein
MDGEQEVEGGMGNGNWSGLRAWEAGSGAG